MNTKNPQKLVGRLNAFTVMDDKPGASKPHTQGG